MNKIKLFCFPYAGGSEAIFTRWEQYIAPSIQLVPVELPGRSRRILDEPFRDKQQAVSELLQLLKKDIYHSRYALFGHSMGAMLCYELAQRIQAAGLPSPAHIFFSGRRAPHVARHEATPYHLLDDEAFKQKIKELGGTPPEFFDFPELIELFLPILRSDFRIAEEDRIGQPVTPLDSDITVLIGTRDGFTREQCDGWHQHSKGISEIRYFEGGHFFLHDYPEDIVRIVNSKLSVRYYQVS